MSIMHSKMALAESYVPLHLFLAWTHRRYLVEIGLDSSRTRTVVESLASDGELKMGVVAVVHQSMMHLRYVLHFT